MGPTRGLRLQASRNPDPSTNFRGRFVVGGFRALTEMSRPAENFQLKLHPADFQMSRPKHGILFEGLGPHLSKGLFGKGTYLPEDAAKIDQYLKQDLEWRSNKPDHELHKLYEVGVKHTTHVYYALVCRTALGAAAITIPPSRAGPPGSLSRRLQSAPAFRTFSVHKWKGVIVDQDGPN